MPRKFMSIMLIAFLLASVCIGCGENPSNTTPTTSNIVNTTTPTTSNIAITTAPAQREKLVYLTNINVDTEGKCCCRAKTPVDC